MTNDNILLEVVTVCKTVQLAMLKEFARCRKDNDTPNPEVMIAAEHQLFAAANDLLFDRHRLGHGLKVDEVTAGKGDEKVERIVKEGQR